MILYWLADEIEALFADGWMDGWMDGYCTKD
jgi:hypothetical protein